ncbi:hypothetical protein ACOKGD_01245 [Microbacterium phosphatis]|uniref:hypothetical protein n=1 Tax=Microbacterium phosphatis TaxID=3140248 RepID=UPI0031401400
MMRRLAAVTGIVALTLALGSCTSRSSGPDQEPPTTPAADPSQWGPDSRGNGLWLLTGPPVIDEIVEAVREAGPVTYRGSFTEMVTPEDADTEPYTGRTLKVEYRGEYGAMAAGITAGDMHVDLVMADGRVYARGNAAYAERTGVAEFRTGFVCTTSADAILSEWEPLLDPAALVEALLSGAEEIGVAEPAPDASTTEVVIGGSETPFGRLTIAAAGAPLPAHFVAGDASGDGDFTFADWGVAPEITVPTELSQPCE